VRQQDGELIKLTFKAQEDGYPVAVRVRRLLKHALRVLGLRCVAVDWKPGKAAGVPQDERRDSKATRAGST
jgi:hypothetical protein